MAYRALSPDSDILCQRFAGFADAGIIAHGFFGRQGGVSQGIFASLNCGPGSGDDPACVAANRALVAAKMGASPDNLLSLHQIHSAECLIVNAPWRTADRPKADAFVTDRPGIALGILSADCAPVLFCGRAGGKPVIGAAHAGWKGAIGGVLEATVERMEKDYGVHVDTIRACIGPCIQKKSYEVSQDFADNFLKQDAENEKFFQESRKAGFFQFDLSGYCAARLAARGIRQVTLSDTDTYSAETACFSYRRATHRREPDYGRQISVIVINDQ